MIRKLTETMDWYRRYRNSKRKNSTFRRVVRKKFRKILKDEKATKVVVEAIVLFAVAAILLICWVDLAIRHALIMTKVTGVFFWIVIIAAISCLVRLHPIRVEASRTAAYAARKARGDYDKPDDDDDEGRLARHDARYATRRRQSSAR